MSRSTCIFCQILREEAPASVVHRGDRTLAFLDIRPVRWGHTLVVPRRHVREVGELPEADVEEIWRVARAVAAVQREMGRARGHHFLLNDGRAANQTVGHAHLHVVPRRGGDLAGLVLGLGWHFARLVFRWPVSRTMRRRLEEEAAALRGALEGARALDRDPMMKSEEEAR